MKRLAVVLLGGALLLAGGDALARTKTVRVKSGEAVNKDGGWFDRKVTDLSGTTFDTRLRYWLMARLGTPYGVGHLGEEQFPDEDPVFALDKADCTTLILTSTALAQSTSYPQARDRMEALNYRCDGLWCPVTYENRLHFTSDRINGGSASFKDITTAVKAPQEAFATVKLVLNRKADGVPLLNLHWERPMTLTYLQAGYVTADLLKQLPPTVGVAFVKKAYFTNGLVVAHEAMLLDGKTMIHASSTHKKVVKEDFLAYLRPRTKDARFDGVLFYKILPGSFPQSDPLIQMRH